MLAWQSRREISFLLKDWHGIRQYEIKKRDWSKWGERKCIYCVNVKCLQGEMIWEHLPAPPSAPCLLTGTPASHLISQSLLDSVYEAWLVDYKAHLETTQCLCVSVSNLVYELACFHFSQGILCFFLSKLFWKATLKIFFHPFFSISTCGFIWSISLPGTA